MFSFACSFRWAKRGSHEVIQAGKSVPGLVPVSVPHSKLCSNGQTGSSGEFQAAKGDGPVWLV